MDKFENGKNTKFYLIILIIAIAVIAICLFVLRNINNQDAYNSNMPNGLNNVSQSSDNINSSFYNMQIDDSNFTDGQKAVLQYFNNGGNYFDNVSPSVLQDYPELFNQTKIQLITGVLKILKSTEQEIEFIALEDPFGYNFGPNKTIREELTIGSVANERLCIVKSSKLNGEILENDWLNIIGNCAGTETVEIDGVSYTLPVINEAEIEKMDTDASKETAKLVKTVAEYIFGEDIKITNQIVEPQPIYDINGDYQGTTSEEQYYLVTLDNPKKEDFKAFKMTSGLIEYDRKYNDLPDNITKKLFISADFEHFIVTTYDSNLKYFYIDYLDKDLNQIWTRQFEYTSKDATYINPMDYTESQMAIVVDNNLYIIDLNNGKDVVPATMVGPKTKLFITSDGIVLIGNENKDLVVKLDFSGNFIYRINGNSKITSIKSTNVQIINGKVAISIYGLNENSTSDLPDEQYIIKYMVIDKDGNIEYSTDDLSAYMG